MPNCSVSARRQGADIDACLAPAGGTAPRAGPDWFSRNSDNCWIFTASLRSITRLALPSLRWMVRGATSRTAAAQPERVLERFAPAASCRSSSAPILSLKTSGVTSTCTSISSSPLLAREHDLVVRQRALDRQQRGLDLRRKHVHAADDEHVVAAPADAPDAPQRAAAAAGLGRERGDVARAVADHRHGLLAERGEHQLAFLPSPAASLAVSGSMISG